MNSDLASRRNIADLSIQGTIETLKDGRRHILEICLGKLCPTPVPCCFSSIPTSVPEQTQWLPPHELRCTLWSKLLSTVWWRLSNQRCLLCIVLKIVSSAFLFLCLQIEHRESWVVVDVMVIWAHDAKPEFLANQFSPRDRLAHLAIRFFLCPPSGYQFAARSRPWCFWQGIHSKSLREAFNTHTTPHTSTVTWHWHCSEISDSYTAKYPNTYSTSQTKKLQGSGPCHNGLCGCCYFIADLHGFCYFFMIFLDLYWFHRFS